MINSPTTLPAATDASTAPVPIPTPVVTQSENIPLATQATAGQKSEVPAFEHIITVLFENRNYTDIIGSAKMPVYNQLAEKYVLLTNYYGVAHPSLPNYISLIGGDTFGIKSDCTDCWLNQPSLPDLIEASGRTWKTYQEGLPSDCFVGNSGKYAQKHDPFLYFDSIRKNAERCKRSVVSFDGLANDLAANQLPNYAFIMPDLCHSAHDCGIDVADKWLGGLMDMLLASPLAGKQYLIAITFDESGSDNTSCCGLPAKAGGRVAAVLVSPQAKSAFKDSTPYSHYSLLKTISLAWGLPTLGLAGGQETRAITAPWQ